MRSVLATVRGSRWLSPRCSSASSRSPSSDGRRAPVTLPQQAPDLVAFGEKMFSIDGWVAPFEIASLVLTAALVAAVLWSREGDE